MDSKELERRLEALEASAKEIRAKLKPDDNERIRQQLLEETRGIYLRENPKK
jgi:hypothetical protein